MFLLQIYYCQNGANIFFKKSLKRVHKFVKKLLYDTLVPNKRDFGGNAKLTIYPENGHNSWDATFSNPEVYKWLLSHKNENANQIIDIYNDIKKYG